MFYLEDEVDLFEENGGRKDRKLLQLDDTGAPSYGKIAAWMGDSSSGLSDALKTPALSRAVKDRKNYYDRGNGNFASGPNGRVQGKINVFRVKPYIVSCHPDPRANGHPQHFPYDKFRVFGKAISNASPFEQLDVMLSRQSI